MDPAVPEIRRCLRGARRCPSGPLGRPPAGSLPRPPLAVLFDVYGTLLCPAQRPRRGPFSPEARMASLVRRHGLALSPAWIASALRQAIEREHAALRARGIPHPEVRIERMWGQVLPGRTDEELRMIAAGWEAAVRPAVPAPGCRALLRSLHSAGLRLGIVSNAQFYTPLFFEVLLRGRPDHIGFSAPLCIYSYELAAAKPGPELLALAAHRLAGLGIEPGRTLVAGNDIANDIAPAAACGFMTALVGWGAAFPAAADAVVPGVADLGALVSRALRDTHGDRSGRAGAGV
jgi:putative hydrolase of the HAD superfamily